LFQATQNAFGTTNPGTNAFGQMNQPAQQQASAFGGIHSGGTQGGFGTGSLGKYPGQSLIVSSHPVVCRKY